MDLKMVGDIWYNYGGSPCEMEPDYFDFMDRSNTSQVVFTESAATCLFNNIALSPIGKLDLD
jgi:hypothetical protein